MWRDLNKESILPSWALCTLAESKTPSAKRFNEVPLQTLTREWFVRTAPSPNCSDPGAWIECRAPLLLFFFVVFFFYVIWFDWDPTALWPVILFHFFICRKHNVKNFFYSYSLSERAILTLMTVEDVTFSEISFIFSWRVWVAFSYFRQTDINLKNYSKGKAFTTGLTYG